MFAPINEARTYFFPCRANQVQTGDFKNTKTMEVPFKTGPLFQICVKFLTAF